MALALISNAANNQWQHVDVWILVANEDGTGKQAVIMCKHQECEPSIILTDIIICEKIPTKHYVATARVINNQFLPAATANPPMLSITAVTSPELESAVQSPIIVFIRNMQKDASHYKRAFLFEAKASDFLIADSDLRPF